MTPTTILKPHAQMTLDELRRDASWWDKFIDESQGWGAALAVAIEFRTSAYVWIAQRLCEQDKERAA